jgi:hypothetical protein
MPRPPVCAIPTPVLIISEITSSAIQIRRAEYREKEASIS